MSFVAIAILIAFGGSAPMDIQPGINSVDLFANPFEMVAEDLELCNRCRANGGRFCRNVPWCFECDGCRPPRMQEKNDSKFDSQRNTCKG